MANRYGVFGTGLTLRQVNHIMKKTQDLYNKTGQAETPSTVMIEYNPDIGKWTVTETYDYPKSNKKLKGRIMRTATQHFARLGEYVFKKEFVFGNILIDAMGFPGGNVYGFNIGHVRTEWGLMEKDFSIDLVPEGSDQDENGNPVSLFDVNIFD